MQVYSEVSPMLFNRAYSQESVFWLQPWLVNLPLKQRCSGALWPAVCGSSEHCSPRLHSPRTFIGTGAPAPCFRKVGKVLTWRDFYLVVSSHLEAGAVRATGNPPPRDSLWYRPHARNGRKRDSFLGWKLWASGWGSTTALDVLVCR